MTRVNASGGRQLEREHLAEDLQRALDRTWRQGAEPLAKALVIDGAQLIEDDMTALSGKAARNAMSRFVRVSCFMR